MENDVVLSEEMPLDVLESGEDGMRVKDLYRVSMRGQTIRLFLGVLFFGLFAVAMRILSGDRMMFGLMLGVSLIFLLYAVTLQLNIRRLVQKARRDQVVRMEAFPDRLRIAVHIGDAEQARWSIYPDTEKRVLQSKRGTVMVARGQLFGLTRAEAAAHPAIASFFTVSPEQQAAQAAEKRRPIIWLLLLFLCGGTLFFSHGADRIASPGLRLMLSVLLVFGTLALSISCFLVKGKRKLFVIYGVVGVIASLSFIFSTVTNEWRLSASQETAAVSEVGGDAYDTPDSTDFAVITAYTEPLGIALPDCDDVLIWYNDLPAGEEGFLMEGWLTYTGLAKSALKRSIQSDERWITEVPSVLIGALPPLGIGDAVLLYNMDTGEYNTIPAKTGTYRFLALNYWADYGELFVAEYQVCWVAE